MRNLILSVSVFIITLLIGVSSTSAQTIPLSMLPDVVAEMNKELPKEIEKGYVLNRFYLKPDNSCFVAEFIVDEKEMNLTSDEFINALDAMKPEDIQSMLGDAEWTEMLPVPFIFEYRFTDGKVYEMPLTALKETISLSMLPDVVAEMNKELPKEIEKGYVLNRFYLKPDSSCLVIEAIVDEKVKNLTSDEFINALDAMTPEEKLSMFADTEWTEELPVPVVMEWKFTDGKVYEIPLTAQKESVTLSMLPDVVAEMNKELPDEWDKGLVCEKIYLMPDNSGMVFEFKVNLREAGMTSDDVSKKLETLKKDGGWKDLSEMFPVPVFFELKCDDGKSFTLPISE